MSQQQYHAEVGSEEEREWLYELEARRIEDANTVLQEIAAARQDYEFIEQLEAKYPGLKGWSK
jgi:hypothetical protein